MRKSLRDKVWRIRVGKRHLAERGDRILKILLQLLPRREARRCPRVRQQRQRDTCVPGGQRPSRRWEKERKRRGPLEEFASTRHDGKSTCAR